MAKLSPIYRERGKVFQTDTCGPVSRAVRAGQLRLQALSRNHYPGRRLRSGTLPGVSTVGFFDAGYEQDWATDWHRNEGIELTFTETGGVTMLLDGHRWRLQANDLTITRPWQPHRLGDPRVSAVRMHYLVLDVGVRRPNQAWHWPGWLVLTPSDRQELTKVLRQNEQVVWHADDELRRCFQHIGHSVETDSAGSSVSRLAIYLNELFMLVLEMFRHRDVPLDESLCGSRRTVELFLTELATNREHLARPWTVRAMARHCGLGTTHLTHHCKQLLNMTPVQYVKRCRVEAAARLLLEEPRLSITEVALECGFSSGQHFSTVFREHFGYAPVTFRANPPS